MKFRRAKPTKFSVWPFSFGRRTKTEMMVKQIVAFQPKQFLRRSVATPPHDLRHGNLAIVVADSVGNASERTRRPACVLPGTSRYTHVGMPDKRRRHCAEGTSRRTRPSFHGHGKMTFASPKSNWASPGLCDNGKNGSCCFCFQARTAS